MNTTVWILCVMLAVVNGNLLSNAECDSTNLSGNWFCQGPCRLESSTDSYSGSHSVKATGRTSNWNGVGQKVNVHGGTVYRIDVYVKLLNLAKSGVKTQSVDLEMACQDSHGVAKYITFGTTPHVQPGQWYGVGGVEQIPNGYHSCHIYVQTDAPSDYLVDHTSADVVTYEHGGFWKTTAHARIEQNRKADIHIRLTGSGSVDIELTQKKMEFILGSAVSARKIVSTSQDNRHYQDVFYKNFEWGVLENMLKWRMMEGSRGHIDYNTGLTAVNSMISHGVKVRCHCVFWDKDQFNADWVKHLSPSQLKTAIHERVTGIIGKTHGKCEQWDINNENLHGSFFEDHTGDLNITMDMFRQVHALDSKPLLFLNDYSVISNAQSAMALRDLGMKYKNAGVPIGGLGIQGHMHHTDVQVVKARVELVAEAGLPIMITELGINENDVNQRATQLVDTLTMLFSIPSVKGILLWGFWDHQIWEHEAALYTGSSVTPNAAGRAFEDLVQSWHTHLTKTVHGGSTFSTRGYKGEYELKVKQNGHVIKTETFTLGNGGKTLTLAVSGGTAEIVG